MAHERLLRKIPVTRPHKKSVLALRRAKTSAFDWTGAAGVSTMNKRIQDGSGECGNSFPQAMRNLFVNARLDEAEGESKGLLEFSK
jgi:hypothetical protein